MDCLFCKDDLDSSEEGLLNKLICQTYCNKCKTLHTYIRDLANGSYRLIGYCVYLYDYNNEEEERERDKKYWFIIDLGMNTTDFRFEDFNHRKSLIKFNKIIDITPDNIEHKVLTYLSFI